MTPEQLRLVEAAEHRERIREMAALDQLPAELRIAISFSPVKHSPAAFLKAWREGFAVDVLIEVLRRKDAQMCADYRRLMSSGGH